MNKYIAEVIGTFALVLAGCGAIVVDQDYDGPLGHLGICLVFGLVVMAMIYSVGNISGAHLNPAVTLGFCFAGRLPFTSAPPYIASQLVGALLASQLHRLLFPLHAGNFGATLPAGGMAASFGMEVVLTFLLMFVILNVSTGHMEKGIMAGVAIGGTVALCALFGGPVSGASMNPARSLGPALAAGEFEALIPVYIVAPILGAFLAHPTCRLVQGAECCQVAESLPDKQAGPPPTPEPGTKAAESGC